MSTSSRSRRRHWNRARTRQLLIEQLEVRALLAATITVNSSLDTSARDSLLTLREAILVNNRTLAVASLTTAEKAQVNGTPGSTDTDTIAFNIPGTGVRTIAPISALPPVIDPVVIDGYTQPGAARNTSATGWNGQLLVELNGSNLNNVNALVIAGGRSTVRGLVINRFRAAPNVSSGAAILLASPGTQSVITGNILGADATGMMALGNAAGVAVSSGVNTIGGNDPDERNIIAGNDFGTVFDAFSGDNRVRGNYIGVNASGTAALGNRIGIAVHSNHPLGTIIGGTAAGLSNVISGNTLFGVWLAPGSKNTDVQGNLVGTDATGTIAVANDVGIFIQNSEENLIGGTTAAAGNLISGNTSYGLRMAADGAFGQSINNAIQGNRIGTDISGILPLGNARGVHIGDKSFFDNDIGGTGTGAGNTIAFNTFEGVSMVGFPVERNSVLRNSIFSNGTLGIDLCGMSGACGNGVTTNDIGDGDFFGANKLQNYPEFALAHLNGATLTLQYAVPTTTSAATYPLRVEFFKADADGQEGQTYLGFDTYTSAYAGGLRTVSLSPGVALLAGDRLVATATDNLGNTSEFSANVAVQVRPCSTLVINTNDGGSGSLREAITCANNTPGFDVISFTIPSGGVHTIVPASALPAITEAVFIDGYSEPGAAPNTNAIDHSDPTKRGLNGTLLIQLAGPATPVAGMHGLTISASGSTVRGLVINGFSASGISINGGDNNLIAGNYFGTDAAGAVAAGNANWGIRVEGGANGNVVGTNGDGIADAAERNLISGNDFAGLAIVGSGSDSNIVAGNLIGTDRTGTAALGNANRGVAVFGGAKNNRIGTNADGVRDGAERNVISGNLWEGVGVYEAGTSQNVVAGNWIGLDVTGAIGVPNVLGGVVIFNAATANTIGGLGTGAGNTIAFNTGEGVRVSSATARDNPILGNAIYENSGLGIHLGEAGGTANDLEDADTGSNQLQNSPEVFDAKLGDGMLDLSYYVLSLPENSAFPLRIEFFKADADGQEGQTFLGFDTYDVAHASSVKQVSFNSGPTIALGDHIVATATDSNGNTSEFGASIRVDSQPCNLVVFNTLDSGPGSLREAINCADVTTNIDRDDDSIPDPDPITFDIPADDFGHFYYANDFLPGQVSPDRITRTIDTDDAQLFDPDPDWPHSWWSIQPFDDLPLIFEPITIDGYSQTGASPNTNAASSGQGLNTVLKIELKGAANSETSIGIAIQLNSGFGGSTVRGLAINQVQLAIHSLADGSAFQGNFIGTDVSGTNRVETFFGVSVQDANENRVGGIGAADRNLIAADFESIKVISTTGAQASHNVVQGNLIGTDITGTKSFGISAGIVLASLEGGQAFGNEIGGVLPDARNVISGCFVGIVIGSQQEFLNGEVHDNLVEGNYIGTDVTGHGDVGNETGISVGAVGTTQRNIVRSNRIAFNRYDGIAITGNAVENPILSNSIFANGFQSDILGIDLAEDSRTPNDAGDADTGPNNLQNFPEISYATKSGEMLLVTYRVNSSPENSNYPLRIEFFQTGVIATGDQGETYLGFDTFTEADFNAGFKTITIPTVAPVFIDGFVGIVAAATDSLPDGGPASTSEFSPGTVLAAPWHNFFKPLDVAGGPGNLADGKIVAGDALAVINYLNAFGSGPVPVDAATGQPFGFLDTVFDNFVAPADALEVINYLNAFGSESEGEGEQESEVRGQESAAASRMDDLVSLLAFDSATRSSRRRR